MMTKEMIFEEFKIVKDKDAKKKKNDYAHTIAYLQGHVDAKREHPNQYRNQYKMVRLSNITKQR